MRADASKRRGRSIAAIPVDARVLRRMHTFLRRCVTEEDFFSESQAVALTAALAATWRRHDPRTYGQLLERDNKARQRENERLWRRVLSLEDEVHRGKKRSPVLEVVR